MTDGSLNERRRRKIHERITTGRLPASLEAEAPTWIPAPYIMGTSPAICHYCDEDIGADEALLVRGPATCHAACEEAWRDLVTHERGDG